MRLIAINRLTALFLPKVIRFLTK